MMELHAVCAMPNTDRGCLVSVQLEFSIGEFTTWMMELHAVCAMPNTDRKCLVHTEAVNCV
jgi:hypothetical protein